MIKSSQVRFIQGNEACAEAAIAAGCRFFAGYPITPSTEIMEKMCKLLPSVNGHFMQMEDEIASISSVIGASWAGAKAMTATSGPGFSLMQEGIGYAAMTETPIVIVDVQRSGPSTGQATLVGQGDIMQARFGSHGDYEIIAVAPSTAQEMFDLTVDAFNLAETYRVPVIVLSDAMVGQNRERVTLRRDREIKIVDRKTPIGGEELFFGGDEIPPMPKFGDGFFVHITGSTHRADGIREETTVDVHEKLVTRLCAKIEKNKEKIVKFEEHFTEDADILVIGYGATARPSLGGVVTARERGIPAGFFRPVTIWPSPEKKLEELLEHAKTIILCECSLRGYKPEIERIAKRKAKIIHFPKIGGTVHTSTEVFNMIQRCI
ncbi:MAG: 2-oxoacid:acceptor oxidoreductase subunit alpha [Thermoplasmata archaeon]